MGGILLVGSAVLAVLILWVWGGMGMDGLFGPARDRTWEAMQRRNTWRVGMDPSFPPFEQLDAQGAVVGFDIDLARALAVQWGMEVEIVALAFDSLTDAVKTGQVDSVISALPYDPRLTRDLAYSKAYFDAGVYLAVRQESSMMEDDNLHDRILSGELLAGKVLAVELGSAGDAVARSLQRKNVGKNVAIQVKRFETPDAAINALLSQQADALLSDHVSLRLAQGAGKPLAILTPALEGNPYVIAMPLHARQLQKQVDEAFNHLYQSNEFAKLETTWFGAGQ